MRHDMLSSGTIASKNLFSHALLETVEASILGTLSRWSLETFAMSEPDAYAFLVHFMNE